MDTDVIVAAMRSPRGASAEVLRCVALGQTSMLLSVGMAVEYEAVCQRPAHRHAAGLEETEVTVFVTGLIALAEPVMLRFHWRPQLRDPEDEMVLEAAVNGQATAIVTFNRRDYGGAPERFSVELWTPGEALRRIRG